MGTADSRSVFTIALCAMILLGILGIITVFSSPVSALGISPSRTVFYYDGVSLEKDFQIRVLGLSDSEYDSLELSIDGDLMENIKVSRSEGLPGTFDCHVSLNRELSPGPHTQKIMVSSKNAGGATVAASISVISELIINVAYPKDYLESTLSISSDYEGSIQSTLMINNLGTSEIKPDLIRIEIYDQGDSKDSFELPMAEIVLPGEFVKVTGQYDGVLAEKLSPGIYEFRSTIKYSDDDIATAKAVSAIGTPQVILDKVSYVEESGNIQPIGIEGRLRWNRPSSVKVNVFYDSVKSPVYAGNITVQESFSDKIYIDVTKFGRPNESIRVEMSVVEDSNAKDSSGIKTFVVSKAMVDKSKFNLSSVLLWAILLFALLSTMAFYLYLLKKKNL